MLQFHCPTERKDFDSGIWLDPDTYRRKRLSIVAADCPHCGRKHRYLLADAQFTAEEAEDATAPIAPQ
jgi:hypothetical protein